MKYLSFVLLVVLFISCRSGVEKDIIENVGDMDSVETLKYGIPMGDYEVVLDNIKSGDFFGNLMRNIGVDYDIAQKIIALSGKKFDVKKIKVGNEYEVFYKREGDSLDKSPSYFVYEKDKVSHVVIGLKDSVYIDVVEKDVELKKKFAKIEITSSLWNDMQRAGVPALLAVKLEDVFAWSIDFSGLQEGDSFEVLYEELTCDGKYLDIGDVFYITANHCGKSYPAVRYEIKDKGAMFWNENGESLKKAFLKAPLRFTRISSGFTYARKHPVLKIFRPHTGVDYAAPKGTPVMSIGDGIVVKKGWGGGGGNTVKIKHNNTYTTSYMHLHSYAKGIKVGQRVKQGEVIGTVGSTGLSTGPHLDFRVYKNGKPINPLKMESPAAEPLSKEFLGDFKAVGEVYKKQMDSIIAEKHYIKFLEVLQ